MRKKKRKKKKKKKKDKKRSEMTRVSNEGINYHISYGNSDQCVSTCSSTKRKGVQLVRIRRCHVLVNGTNCFTMGQPGLR